jgi:hypothetical protein
MPNERRPRGVALTSSSKAILFFMYVIAASTSGGRGRSGIVGLQRVCGG